MSKKMAGPIKKKLSKNGEVIPLETMRRLDRKMSDEAAKELLARSEYGILSTVNAKGQPAGTPLSYIYLNGFIYFHCAMQGTLPETLESNPQVGFTVVGATKVIADKFTTNYESVMVEGKASTVEGTEKTEALLGLVEKYSPEFLASGKEYIERAQEKTLVIKVEVAGLIGKHRVG